MFVFTRVPRFAVVADNAPPRARAVLLEAFVLASVRLVEGCPREPLKRARS